MRLPLKNSYTALIFVGSLAAACGTSDPDPVGQGGTSSSAAGTSPGPKAGSSSGGSGVVGTGGQPTGTAGATGSAGATGTTGGNTGVAGATGSSGSSSGGATGSAGTSSGGTTSGGSSTGGGSSGGSGGSGMVPGETKPTVTAPASSKTPKDYFVMGETRLLNNNWGALELGCSSASYEIFVNTDKSFGWKWSRPSCGGNATKPDYPEVEFGIHPFGKNKALVTSPDYSSTTVLPIQVKDVTSASVNIDSMNINPTGDINWNMNFEMWFTDQHPVTGNHMGAYGETMNWFGWDSKQYTWPDNGSSSLDAGLQFKLGHSADSWPDAPPHWKYRQWRLSSATKSFSGTVDIKKILDYLVNTEHWPNTLWISRFEVGTELDDGSAGTVTIKKITFEVNGQKRSTDIK